MLDFSVRCYFQASNNLVSEGISSDLATESLMLCTNCKQSWKCCRSLSRSPLLNFSRKHRISTFNACLAACDTYCQSNLQSRAPRPAQSRMLSTSLNLCIIRKILVSVKILSAILGQKWLRQFYGRLEFLRSFCRETPHVHKIPRFFGGWVFWVGGEGSAVFFFLWARGFF